MYFFFNPLSMVDSSTVICWSPFIILRMSGLLCCFCTMFDGNSG